MGKVLLWNILLNATATGVLVMLNQWAVRHQLEETFVALALLYGVGVTIANAVFVSATCRK